MKAWWLKLSVSCLICGSGWPAFAAEPVVILDRPDWVQVLAKIDHLQQTVANLEAQVTVYERQAAELTARTDTLQGVIEQLEAQRATDQKEKDLLNQEVQRLQAELDSKTFWSKAKDYGLVGLGVLAAVLAIL